MKNESSSPLTQKRNYYFDILKIFAILAVVLIHSSSANVEYAKEFACADFMYANILNAISRFSVPVFVMVSGALMLEESKKLDTRIIFKKYVKNIVLMFIFWSALFTYVFSWYVPVSKGKTVLTENLIIRFIEGNYHMWYLYMLIGLYIATPVLRQFVRRDKKDTVVYFLKVSFVVQAVLHFVLQLLSHIADIRLHETYDDLNFYTFLGYSFYYVLGWYLHNFDFTKKQKRTVYILGIASILFSILFTYFMSVSRNEPFLLTYKNFYFNNVLYSTAIFLFFKGRFSRCEFREKAQKIIRTLSSLTFGVFIIHPFFVELFRPDTTDTRPEATKMLVLWLTVTAVSFAVCFVLSKIPVVKKLIRS